VLGGLRFATQQEAERYKMKTENIFETKLRINIEGVK